MPTKVFDCSQELNQGRMKKKQVVISQLFFITLNLSGCFYGIGSQFHALEPDLKEPCPSLQGTYKIDPSLCTGQKISPFYFGNTEKSGMMRIEESPIPNEIIEKLKSQPHAFGMGPNLPTSGRELFQCSNCTQLKFLLTSSQGKTIELGALTTKCEEGWWKLTDDGVGRFPPRAPLFYSNGGGPMGIGYVKEQTLISRSPDGALLTEKLSAAIGINFFIPVFGYTRYRCTFEPIRH